MRRASLTYNCVGQFSVSTNSSLHRPHVAICACTYVRHSFMHVQTLSRNLSDEIVRLLSRDLNRSMLGSKVGLSTRPPQADWSRCLGTTSNLEYRTCAVAKFWRAQCSLLSGRPRSRQSNHWCNKTGSKQFQNQLPKENESVLTHGHTVKQRRDDVENVDYLEIAPQLFMSNLLFGIVAVLHVGKPEGA
jgi:hypothetical protein